MEKEKPCDCLEYQKQLSECKERKNKDCEEKTKEQSSRISILEKKIMTLTIVGAVAVTVIGKEMVDKIINKFNDVQQVQDKLTGSISKKENNTDDKVTDSSSNGGDPFRSTN
jgi:hypothetical protein